jgi:hypothetical protein
MDQSLFAAPHGFSQRITSFIACACLGIHQMPLRHLIVLIANAHPYLASANLSSSLALEGVLNPTIRTHLRVPKRSAPRPLVADKAQPKARLPFTTGHLRCHRRVRYGPCYKRTRRACAWPYLKTSFSRSNPGSRGQATIINQSVRGIKKRQQRTTRVTGFPPTSRPSTISGRLGHPWSHRNWARTPDQTRRLKSDTWKPPDQSSLHNVCRTGITHAHDANL